MGKLSDLIVKIGLDSKGLNKSLGDSRRKFNRNFGQIARSAKRAGAAMSAAFTAPLLAMASKSFGVAVKFEDSMAKVRAVSGATGEEFKKLSQNARALGASTRYTQSEVAGLQLEFARLGLSATEITQVSEATLQLAQATGSDLARSAEVAGATLKGFGLNASEMQRVTDVMAASMSSSALTMDTFADSMKMVAPVAAAAGISVEEASAMLASMANSGLKGSRAGTALRRIMSEMVGTGGNLSEKIEALSKKTLTLADAKDEVGRNAQTALIVLRNSTEATAKLTEEYKNAEGAAAGMAAIMDDTAGGAMARMRSAIEAAQESIGRALIPIVTKLAAKITEIAQRFASMSDGTKKKLIAIAAILGAAGPIMFAFGALMPVIAALTGPVGLVALAIVALGVLIFKFWDQIEPVFLQFANKMITLQNKTKIFGLIFNVLKAGVVANLRVMVQSFLTLLNAVMGVIGAVTDLWGVFTGQKSLSDVWDGLVESFNGIKDGWVELGKETADSFADAFSDALATGEIALLKPGFMSRAFEGLWPGEKSAIEDAIKKAPVLTMQIAGGASSAGAGLMGGTREVKDLPADFYAAEEAGIDFITAINRAVNDAAQSVAVAMAEMLGSMMAGGEGFGNMRNVVVGIMADMAIQIGKVAISIGVAIEAIRESLRTIHPAVVLAAGIALVALGSYAKTSLANVPKLAEGGLAFGPTMAVVGDNRNAASDPEVIAPLSKLRGMMGGGNQNLIVTGRISGRDIVLSNQRGGFARRRLTGK